MSDILIKHFSKKSKAKKAAALLAAAGAGAAAMHVGRTLKDRSDDLDYIDRGIKFNNRTSILDSGKIKPLTKDQKLNYMITGDGAITRNDGLKGSINDMANRYKALIGFRDGFKVTDSDRKLNPGRYDFSDRIYASFSMASDPVTYVISLIGLGICSLIGFYKTYPLRLRRFNQRILSDKEFLDNQVNKIVSSYPTPKKLSNRIMNLISLERFRRLKGADIIRSQAKDSLDLLNKANDNNYKSIVRDLLIKSAQNSYAVGHVRAIGS